MASPSLKRSAGDLANPAVESKRPKTNGSITSFFGAPKPKENGAATTKSAVPSSVSSFNKQKWVATLTPEQKELLRLEIDTMDESWLAHLKEELIKPEFLALKRFLQKEKQMGVKVFPPEEDIYSWFERDSNPVAVYELTLGCLGLVIRLYTKLKWLSLVR
jgi:uracil-DNA glycosylase